MSLEQIVAKLIAPSRLTVLRIVEIPYTEPVPAAVPMMGVALLDWTGRKANAGLRQWPQRSYLTTGESDCE